MIKKKRTNDKKKRTNDKNLDVLILVKYNIFQITFSYMSLKSMEMGRNKC